MNKLRVNSSPQLAEQYYNDSALEGVAANVKLLLKLIQDHQIASYKENKDGRRMLRVATMMTILDNIRSRIQKCQTFRKKGLEGGFQGDGSSCNSKQGGETQDEHVVVDDDEKLKLRRELNASLAAQKNLEIMCSSLGREKEIIAAELAMKVHQLNETDELINDLKDQKETLLEKLCECTSDNIEKTKRLNNVVETQENMALQDRNKILSTQLLHSLDGYRAMKRKYKEAQEENNMMCVTMEEIGTKVRTSLDHIHGIKECLDGSCTNNDVKIRISDLEHMLESLEQQVAKHEQKKVECLTLKEEIFTHHPSIVS